MTKQEKCDSLLLSHKGNCENLSCAECYYYSGRGCLLYDPNKNDLYNSQISTWKETCNERYNRVLKNKYTQILEIL